MEQRNPRLLHPSFQARFLPLGIVPDTTSYTTTHFVPLHTHSDCPLPHQMQCTVLGYDYSDTADTHSTFSLTGISSSPSSPVMEAIRPRPELNERESHQSARPLDSSLPNLPPTPFPMHLIPTSAATTSDQRHKIYGKYRHHPTILRTSALQSPARSRRGKCGESCGRGSAAGCGINGPPRGVL